jgi:hypothetical protein
MTATGKPAPKTTKRTAKKTSATAPAYRGLVTHVATIGDGKNTTTTVTIVVSKTTNRYAGQIVKVEHSAISPA